VRTFVMLNSASFACGLWILNFAPCIAQLGSYLYVANMILWVLKADPQEGTSGEGTPHIKATKVTTRMATSVEDKEKNATTSQVSRDFVRKLLCNFFLISFSTFIQQIEEKTFTHTTSTTANRTESTVVTQEMRATATVLTTSGVEEMVRAKFY